MDDWNEIKAQMVLNKEKKIYLKEFSEASGDAEKWQAVYSRYLKSNLWKSIVVRIKPRADGRCEKCKKPFAQSDLELHHLTYARIGGNEKDADIVVACRLCHDKLDKDRDRKTEEENDEAYTDSARENWLNNWAMKKYNDEFWEYTHDRELVEEDFKQYLYKCHYLPANGPSSIYTFAEFEEEYDDGTFFTDPRYRESRC